MINFENIVFDEFTLLEGEQADKYRMRKYNEKKEKERREDSYNKNRGQGTPGRKNTLKNPNMENPWTDKGKEISEKELTRGLEAIHKSYDHAKKNYNFDVNNIYHAIDATNRHMRRHGDK